MTRETDRGRSEPARQEPPFRVHPFHLAATANPVPQARLLGHNPSHVPGPRGKATRLRRSLGQVDSSGDRHDGFQTWLAGAVEEAAKPDRLQVVRETMAGWLNQKPWQCYSTLTFKPTRVERPYPFEPELRFLVDEDYAVKVFKRFEHDLNKRYFGSHYRRKANLLHNGQLSFFMPVERQKNGACHAHPLIAGLPDGWRYKEVQAAWRTAQEAFGLPLGKCWTKPYPTDKAKQREALTSYVAKYCVKDCTKANLWHVSGFEVQNLDVERPPVASRKRSHSGYDVMEDADTFEALWGENLASRKHRKSKQSAWQTLLFAFEDRSCSVEASGPPHHGERLKGDQGAHNRKGRRKRSKPVVHPSMLFTMDSIELASH